MRPALKPIDEMSFAELVDTLALDQERNASRLGAVHRRIMDFLSTSREDMERRRFVRLPSHIPVEIELGGIPVAGTILDVSGGGLRIRAPLSPSIGSTIVIDMQEQGEPVRGRAVVAWVRPFAQLAFDIGVSFFENDDLFHQHIKRLMINLLRSLPAFNSGR